MDTTVHALLQQVDALGRQVTERSSGDSRLQILHAVRKLAIELETEGDIVDRLAYQPVGNIVIRIAVDLGIFDILVKSPDPVTTKALAEKTGADYTLLDIPRLDNPQGYLDGKILVRIHSTSPDNLRGHRDEITDSRLPVWQKVPARLAERGYRNPSNSMETALQKDYGAGKTFWQILNERPKELRDFMTFMASQREGRPSWLDFYPVQSQLIEGFSGSTDAVFFVDIGGAGGHECRALKAKYPDLPGRVILQELSGAIEQVKAQEAKGMEAMVHDFFQPQPLKGKLRDESRSSRYSYLQIILSSYIDILPSGARTYYLRNILHDWNSDLCHTILRHLAAAMKPGYSKLLLDEMVVPLQGASLFTVQSDFNMMASLGGMERTERQWRELLGEVGLEIERIWTGREDVESIIEAVLR
ncbi:MAG: hypothetical protein Q9187_004328 [Circinaria calcarea]